MNQILITKADGSVEPFETEKLHQSLVRAGATEEIANTVIERVIPHIVSGMSTGQIYRHAFSVLRKYARPAAARYSLKRAVMDLGPSGFPFERFIGEIFKAQGYTVLVDQILPGSCVEHEVDVVAVRDGVRIITEAKFHNDLGIKSDLKVALYIQARMEDLQRKADTDKNTEKEKLEGWLITNTSFTETAINYANCMGLKLVSWDYPTKGNLHDLIDAAKLHPITALTTLTKAEKNLLLEDGIVLASALKSSRSFLQSIGIADPRIAAIIEEAEQVCEIH